MPKRKAPEPAEPEPAAEPATAPEEPAGDEDAEFLNRAARRAKGKGKAAAPQTQKGHFPHGQGTRQGPRLWGNRRSG